MKDEIKEILNRFDFVKKEPNKLSYYPEDLLSQEEMWLLYDYITNLQDTLKLRTNIATYIKSKNDKALEYARTHRTTFDINKMINILEGSDKE